MGFTGTRARSYNARVKEGARMREVPGLVEVLRELVLAYGVSGNEGPVAHVISGTLDKLGIHPGRFQRDNLGNQWLCFGPAGDPQRLLIAHMDEIGLRITRIREDGACHVQPVGGFDPQLWEGTTVLVHTESGSIPGCIAPVSHHVSFRTVHSAGGRIGAADLLVDVGSKSAQETRDLGVAVHDTVTWKKGFDQLGGSKVQGRSMDDRFGCTVLVFLAARLAQEPPEVPTAVCWSVQEEVGLKGATALAGRFSNASEVIAVDSFTVGTGPRDVKTFDSVALGEGPALRCWDGTMLVPDEVRRKVLSKASSLGFNLQTGFMPGGNDASVFGASGARLLSFSVPVEYSHSQVERIHTDDLEQLSLFLQAWCKTSLEL